MVLAVATVLAGAAVVVLGVTESPESTPVAASQGELAAADDAADLYPTHEDYCYIEGMIPHHEQALELSELVLAATGVRERTRALAEFILTDQSAEIETMRAWQEAWRRTVPSGGSSSHSGHGSAGGAADANAGIPTGCADHGDHAEMKGMATAEQLAVLEAAEGLDADRMFLELMVVHHEGALEMATQVVTAGSNAFARSSGKHVLVEQEREIAAMTALLAEVP